MNTLKSLIKTCLKKLLFKTRVEKNVAFSRLRFIPLDVCVEEGYGGKKLSSWPIYSFFQTYINGQIETAYSDYHNWYLCRLKKYHSTPPEKGGLYDVPVYRSIVCKYIESNIDFHGDIFFNPEIVSQVIKEEVKSKFALVDSIKENGYNPDVMNPAIIIQGFKRNGIIYLLNGHHRWAILTLFGYDSFPELRLVDVHDDKWWFRAVTRIFHRKHAIYNRLAMVE